MEYEFTARHVVLTPAVQRLVRKELKKLDPILDSAPKRAHVILSAEKNRRCVEIVLHWRDSVFTGISETADLTQSVVAAANKVERQLMRLKEKLRTAKRRRVSLKGTSPATSAASDGVAARRIMPARQYRIKPMTAEEAATIVSDSQDHFIVFRDSETDRVGVLFKRKDGHFGLIEP